MPAPTVRAPGQTRAYGRVAVALIVAALFITDGVLAARQFDLWYLAGSIIREDDRAHCPIDLTFAATSPLNAGC